MLARRLLLLLSLLFTASCGGGDDPAARTPDIDESERQLGAEQHPQLLAEFGGAYQGPEAAYLVRLGEKLAAGADLKGQCTFTLVNTDVVNAFAVPGCYIYVTRGLMGIVGSEAELASVLAHELGHIVGDHGERQQKRSIWRQLGVMAIGFVTGSERLTRIAGEAAGYFTLRYSRKQEYESDDLGIRYLRSAGYDPYAATDMLAALARQERFRAGGRDGDDAKAIPEWVRTHPLTENRIARARETAAATGAAPDSLPENEASYLREVDGLLFGDDPQQGFVVGSRFAHPVMRIGFEAPPGFLLTNSPQAVLIEGPDGTRGEFAGGPMPPGGLVAYADALLRQLLRDAPAEVGAAEPLQANGTRGLVVPVIVQGQQGAVQITLAAYEGRGGNAYHFIMVSQPGGQGAFAPLLTSFRSISDEEARSLRPRRIGVVRAGARDSFQSLASGTAGASSPALLKMLNGRDADEPLRNGEAVKIVSWAQR
jgi:predicted Zn-dependent protease